LKTAVVTGCTDRCGLPVRCSCLGKGLNVMESVSGKWKNNV